jgi:chromosome condensin MukBEF MukE localization factor
MHIKIEAFQDEDKIWCARGIKHSIFTQGATYDELLENIKEAVALHFEEELARGEKVDVMIMSELEIGSVA